MYEREGPAGLLPLMPYPDYACRMKLGDRVLDKFAHEQPERDKVCFVSLFPSISFTSCLVQGLQPASRLQSLHLGC